MNPNSNDNILNFTIICINNYTEKWVNLTFPCQWHKISKSTVQTGNAYTDFDDTGVLSKNIQKKDCQTIVYNNKNLNFAPALEWFRSSAG